MKSAHVEIEGGQNYQVKFGDSFNIKTESMHILSKNKIYNTSH